jgi:hypothetical protein
MQQSQTARGPAVIQLTAAVTLGCVTLVDATGHEHAISVAFCASFEVRLPGIESVFGSWLIKFSLATQRDALGSVQTRVDRSSNPETVYGARTIRFMYRRRKAGNTTYKR